MKSKQRNTCILVLGVILCLIGVVMIPVGQLISKNIVSKNVVIQEGSTVYAQWQSPTIPIYMQFYVFNLTNPVEVLAGAKPYLSQHGPYTYRETRTKVNITWNKNGTVSYKQIRSWYFVPELSAGAEDDWVTTVNLPLITAAETLQYENAVVQELFAGVAALVGEKLFMNLTVKDLIWGYRDPLLAMGKKVLPNWFYTDVLGIYAGKNNTDDGTYSIYTGVNDVTELGGIDTYNGTRSLSFWTSESANRIYGSDGSLCPPFVTKATVLYVFSTDVYRSVYARYIEEVENKYGISVYHFAGGRDVLASPQSNPDNAGFCTPAGNCLGDGLLNLTEPQTLDYFHVPIIASMPHFLYADTRYTDAVVGMRPVENEHRTEAFVEPMTGLVMKISKRLQINAYVKRLPNIAETGNITNVILPLVWVNESAEIDDATADMFKSMVLPMQIIGVAQYVLIAIGGLAIIAAIVIVVLARKGSADEQRPLLIPQEQHTAAPAAQLLNAAEPTPTAK